MSKASAARATAMRRSFAIHGYCGSNGGGKSLAMVNDTLSSLDMGRSVLSTVRLLDFRDPHLCGEREGDVCDVPDEHTGAYGQVHRASHSSYIPLRDYSQIMDAERCDVLFDEVTGIASSRESHSMPMQVSNRLVQLRRADVLLRWSTPNWLRSDKIIREVTQAITLCEGFLPEDRVMGEGEQQRMWRDRRAFHWSTFDAMEFEEWSKAKETKQQRWVGQWHWRSRGLAQNAYDTMSSVNSVGWASEAGLCMACGGHRARPKCSCAPAPEREVVVLGQALPGEARGPAGPSAEPVAPTPLRLLSVKTEPEVTCVTEVTSQSTG